MPGICQTVPRAELHAIVDKHQKAKEQRSKPQDLVAKSSRKLGRAEARIKVVKEKEKIANEKWATYLSELQQMHQSQVEMYMQVHGAGAGVEAGQSRAAASRG